MQRVTEILGEVKRLAAEYYRLTGRPLGVTGEIAEHAVAMKLGLELAPVRTDGFDAMRGSERIQIKALAVPARPSQCLSRFSKHECDVVMFARLDPTTMEPTEIWEAPWAEVAARLAIPGSKTRARGVLRWGEFKRLAKCIWKDNEHA